MRILFLAPIVPWPLTQGRNLRNYHILAYLNRHHTVDLLCGAYRFPSPRIPPDVARLWDRIHIVPWPQRSLARRMRDVFRLAPDFWLAHRSRELVAKGQAMHRAQPYDCIHVAGLEMYGMLRDLCRGLSPCPSVVLDEQNIEFLLQRSMENSQRGSRLDLLYGIYSRLQTRKLYAAEVNAWREVRHVLTVSPEDRREVLQVLPPAAVTLIPNGIDTGAWPAIADDERKPRDLVFMGKMDYRPNVLSMQWFCAHVLPTLSQRYTDTRLWIVGRDPAPDIVALDRIPAVTVTGYVEDVQPFFRTGSIFVLPMFHGGGTRFKVLEALMAGMPLVTTPMGIQGIPLQDRIHCLTAEEPADFIQAIEFLWDDPWAGQALAQRGRRLVEEQFAWSVITPALDSIYPPD